MEASLFMGLANVIGGARALYIDPGAIGIVMILFILLGGVWIAGSMVAAAVMAKNRGYNIAMWVLLAVFIGWIAVLILAIVGQDSSQSDDKKNE